MSRSFMNGFSEELEKLAVNPKTLSWAFSRGITSGVAAATMGLGLGLATGKKKKRDLARSALIPGLIGASVGLGKGFAEKGLERKLLKVMTRGR